MTTGTGPQALKTHLTENWQATRTGRPDIPNTVANPETDHGVIITEDRQEIANQHAVHDLVHCYHPSGGLSLTSGGYKEVNEVEEVQVDVEVTDRTDPQSGERLYARDRLVGDRSDPTFPSGESGPYPGIAGEVKYLLEGVRRGLEEWDIATVDVVSVYLGNSNASLSYSVELEHIARNTIQ